MKLGKMFFFFFKDGAAILSVERSQKYLFLYLFFWSTNIYTLPKTYMEPEKNACFWKGISFFQVATFRFYVSFSDRMRNGAIGGCFFRRVLTKVRWSLGSTVETPRDQGSYKVMCFVCWVTSVGVCGGEVGIFPRGKEDTTFGIHIFLTDIIILKKN